MIFVAACELHKACEQALLFGHEVSLARTRERGARSRETRFTRPNRRACSQAVFVEARKLSGIKYHVYVKFVPRDQGSSFSSVVYCISTPNLVVSGNFLSIRIVLSCFYLLIFYFEKFPAWICRLQYTWSLNSLLSLTASSHAGLLGQCILVTYPRRTDRTTWSETHGLA